MFRELYFSLLGHLKKKQISLITGARQAGKTTILKQLFKHLQSENKNVWFITFENKDILHEIDKKPENIFKFTQRPENPLLKKQLNIFYLLIDEIQYASDPSNFLKYLYDTYSPNLKIIATGSSSFYLNDKFKDSMAGRKRIFILNTLNFNEYLNFTGNDNLKKELDLIRENSEYLSLNNAEIMEHYEDYLIFGGYPDVVMAKTKEEKVLILEELKNSYVKRDILESNVENEHMFYQLMQLLSIQTGNLVNKNELSKSLKMNMKTINRYITIMQMCFHIRLVKPFYKNLKKELVKMPKVYFNDLGLRNSLIKNFHELALRSDKGAILENYIFTRLNEKYFIDEIKFWRTTNQKEVDFVITPSLSPSYAIEVKSNLASIKKKRYSQFSDTYPEIAIKFITYNETVKGENIMSSLNF